MSDISANPPAAAERLPFFQVMLRAYTGPSLANYRRLARNTDANVATAYLWVAVSGAISWLGSTLMLRIFPTNWMSEYLIRLMYGSEIDLIQPPAGAGGFTIYTLICMLPVTIVGGVIGLAIATGLYHWIAGLLGGRGEYRQQVFLIAALIVPGLIINGLLAPIPYLGCLSFLFSLYVLVLYVLAIEGVYQFGIGKAIITLLIPMVAIFLLGVCLVVGAVALLAPVIREATSFSMILSLV